MTAHELAHKLLAGPDHEVVVGRLVLSRQRLPGTATRWVESEDNKVVSVGQFDDEV